MSDQDINIEDPEDALTIEVWSRSDRALVRRVGIMAGMHLHDHGVAHVSFGPGDMTRYDVVLVDLNKAEPILGDQAWDTPERGLLVALTNLDAKAFVVGWPRTDAPHWNYIAGKLGARQSDWTAVILAELIDAAGSVA